MWFLQDGIDAIEEVIYHIETYDVTTIRASTPMFLMSRKIKSLGVKMVISGEGSDEVFGGYLYFHKAPNKEEFHKETCRKVINFTMVITNIIQGDELKGLTVMLFLCRLKPFTNMIACEPIKQHLLGVWKVESHFWTKILSVLQWILILSIRWYRFRILFC